ncbi:MAG TPA: hypothetical protein VIK01_21660, partial [Polyangiaceae bacterium]
MRTRALIRVAALSVFVNSCHPAVQPAVIAPSARSEAGRPLPSAARLARADRRLELSGYREAEADFRALLGAPEATAARVGLGQVLVTTGRYTEAVSVLAPLVSSPTWNADAALWTARAQQCEGDVSAAERTLRSVPTAHVSHALELELGAVLLREGRRADAEPVLMAVVNDYNEDRIKETDGAGLSLVGRAA